MNATSILAIGFEQMIVAAVQEGKPRITDPAVAAEATAFLRQEAQHSASHRKHVTALIERYPGLQQVFDDAMACFDELTETTSLEFRLAYVADLEATFTPSFKLMLDNEKILFRPGDDRVASLFLWHFVEEVDYCDWVSFIDAGKLIANATPEALRERYSDGYRMTLELPAADRDAAEAALVAAGAHVVSHDGTLVASARALGPDLRAALSRLGAGDAAVHVEQPPMTDIFRRMVAEAGAAR